MSSAPHKICANCLTGNVLPGTPVGEMRQFDVGPEGKKQDYYFTPGRGDNSKAIIIGTDIFGLGIPNGKILADLIAHRTGFPVFVPDLFDGDWQDVNKLSMIDKPTTSFLNKVSVYGRMIGSMVWGGLIGWSMRWSMAVSVPKMERFITALKKETGATRVGMAGYCYGGTINLNIAPKQCVDVFVTAHPSNLTAKMFDDLTVPHCLIMAQQDMSFDPVKKDAFAVLAEKRAGGLPVANFEHPGTVHGSFFRPLLSDAVIKREFEKSVEEAAAFFEEYL